MTDTVDQIVEQRGRTHGLFQDNAVYTNSTRHIWRSSPNWDKLHPEQRLALDEIALKVARMLSSGADPDNKENWLDIQGYAKLGERSCK